MTKDEQAKNVAIILIFLNQDSLFLFNINKSIKRLTIKAIIIIISLKKTKNRGNEAKLMKMVLLEKLYIFYYCK